MKQSAFKQGNGQNRWGYLFRHPLQSSLPPKKPLFPKATELLWQTDCEALRLPLMPWGKQLPAALHKYWKHNSLGKRLDQHELRGNYRLLQNAHLQQFPDKGSQRECCMPCGFNNFCCLVMGIFCQMFAACILVWHTIECH